MTRSSYITEAFCSLLALMSMLAGCGAQNQTARQDAIDFALLQPAEMPLGWDFNWGNAHKGQCEERWNIFRYDDASPNVTHVIWDCPSEEAAKALVYEEGSPNLKASRSHIGGENKPPHANEYLAYCDTPSYKILLDAYKEVSMKNCKTLARYGRVVSMMTVNAILPTAKWPLEADLLKWTIERNDAKMVKLEQ
jgi:hypothetical protein